MALRLQIPGPSPTVVVSVVVIVAVPVVVVVAKVDPRFSQFCVAFQAFLSISSFLGSNIIPHVLMSSPAP